MPQVINTNVASLNAQRNLTTNEGQLATALQRLSSGLRINSARDDAAGLAIADRFTSQIRGLNQAARNANDGISLAQTAEGALTEVSNNLQRLRELSVQSANATNSATDRTALQSEAAQLIAEIQRVATSTKFNGVALLDGTFTSKAFQVGADANQTISITAINNAQTTALGGTSTATVTSTPGSVTALASGNLTLNGVTVGASLAASDTVSSSGNAYSAIAKAAAINLVSSTSGVTATVNQTVSAATAITTAALTGTITINGTATASITTGNAAATDSAAVASAINLISATTGVKATDNGAAGVILTAADGRNIAVSFNTLTAAATGVTARAGGSEATGSVTLSSANQIVIAGGTPANAGLTAGTIAVASTGTLVSAINISSVTGANLAITSVDAALATISSTRADLGAYQNRFASTVASLSTTSENLNASRSRILDADFAAETAALTRGQILQQAGIAVLAQANNLPNQVLSLLR